MQRTPTSCIPKASTKQYSTCLGGKTATKNLPRRVQVPNYHPLSHIVTYITKDSCRVPLKGSQAKSLIIGGLWTLN